MQTCHVHTDLYGWVAGKNWSCIFISWTVHTATGIHKAVSTRQRHSKTHGKWSQITNLVSSLEIRAEYESMNSCSVSDNVDSVELSSSHGRCRHIMCTLTYGNGLLLSLAVVKTFFLGLDERYRNNFPLHVFFIFFYLKMIIKFVVTHLLAFSDLCLGG